ncbi:uncharacterized protein RHOBADRAFT_41357 [Rhodotorula graminis WP1]|uniref:Uncharacterized protein n=1 Tax=Rhodotorula graminis (strain WP1) TaxID=578459 RepID=A0A194S9U9_RHOGW|nr:uncharacterized protein RHOBADRAFT_41357 [Rhodotorula graminis WP1]KPV77364.1 hypothetical protein RHOBADRAFT_41357 [Rhodotorula graminis WP1]
MLSWHKRDPLRRFAWWSLRPVGRDPFLPLARHLSRAPEIDVAPDGLVRIYSDRPHGDRIQNTAHPAISILNEDLVECSWQSGGYASSNGGALHLFAASFKAVPQPWTATFTASFYRAYWAAVQGAPDLPATPQQRRHLASEGDVADLVMSNVLSALPSILTSLLRPDLAGLLEVSIHQHPTLKLPKTTQQSQALHVKETTSVFPDHALVLTRRRIATSHKPVTSNLHLQAGYVSPADWQPSSNKRWTQSQNTSAHIKQLIGYSTLAACNYFLLTDYRHGVGVVVETGLGHGGVPTARLAAQPHGTRRTQSLEGVVNPMDRSLRHSICLLAMKAMHDLGVLDVTKAKGLPKTKLNGRIAELVTEHKRERDVQIESDEREASRLARGRDTPIRRARR